MRRKLTLASDLFSALGYVAASGYAWFAWYCELPTLPIFLLFMTVACLIVAVKIAVEAIAKYLS